MIVNIFPVILVAFLAVTYSSPIDDDIPLDCPNDEEYYKCSLILCFKTCQDLKSPPPCPSIASDCVKPSCECKDGFLRNDNGVCVPTIECYEIGYDLYRKKYKRKEETLDRYRDSSTQIDYFSRNWLPDK